MRCIVCDKSEWENVDQYRNKKEGMSLCKSCGFISYPAKWQEKEKVLEYYRKQYRAAPTIENLFQGQRKLNYHHEFLGEPLLDKWLKEGKKDPVVFEVGAAYGLVLAWIKNFRVNGQLLFPGADLGGSELTLTYKRNAYHEFGLELKEDFDDSKQYDLVISYKVAEHILDVDLELMRYRKCLKPDGKLYISVPTWFHRLHNFGANGFSIEYYYAPEHVNTWTRQHFEAILRKTGFKIIKENHSFYDDTYLCEADTERKQELSISLPNPTQIKDWMARIKAADELCQKKMFAEALEQWPNFPVARRALYEYKRKDFHASGIDEIIKTLVRPWIELDKDSYDAWVFGGDLLMRYDRYDQALSYLKEALERRPRDESVLGAISNCYRMLAKKAQTEDQKIHFMVQSREILRFMKEHCLNGFQNAVTGIYSDNACIPMPSEGAALK